MSLTSVAVVGDPLLAGVDRNPPSAYPRLAGPSATNGRAVSALTGCPAVPYLTADQAARCRAILGIALPERPAVDKRALVLLRRALRGMS